MKISFILFLIIIIFNCAYGQSDTLQIISEKYSDMIEDFSENDDSEIYYDHIEELLNNPIELNSANSLDLQRIPFLSPNDAGIIIKERNKRGGFISVNELSSIKNIHPDLVLLIKPFLVVKDKNKKRSENLSFGLQFRSRLLSDLQIRRGFSENKYAGDEFKSYNRLKIESGKFRFGVITEKDAGEESYIDHYAGFLEYRPASVLKQLVIGDYNFEFGQGLVLWSPYSFSKGTEAVNTSIKRERQISPHLSTEENKYLRGGAISLNFNSFTLAGFYSNKNIDANISEKNEIISLTSTGYHRTANEIFNKNKLIETSFGGSLQYSNNDLSIGLLHFRENLSEPFAYTNENDYFGDKFSFTSLAINYLLNGFQYAGEISNNGNGFAFFNSIYLSLSEKIGLTASFRNYSPKYFNFYSNGFGEFSNTQNEIGFYLGLKINMNFGTVNCYYDIFKSPAQSYYSYLPLKGNDMMVNLVSGISTKSKLTVKFKNEVKEILTNKNQKEIIGKEEKSNYRIGLKYDLTKHWSGKSRIEYVKHSSENKSEEGYLAFQEIKYKSGKEYSITTRIILFQTKSYASRVYEFENDLPGVMTNLPMFGEGARWYILCNISLIDNLYLSIKYSETFKPNSTSFGSGYSEIKGDLDNRISMQISFRM